MDSHSAGVVAVLGTVGAATGAISAVLFYAVCMRRKGFTYFSSGKGPLNWFEKDLLDRAKEAEESSAEVFIELGNVASVTCASPVPKELSDNICDDVTWPRKDPPYDASVLNSVEVIHRLSSEGDDEPKTPTSPFAPPLPAGTVVASDERMVIVKSPPRTSSGSRLNSADDSVFHKVTR
ncbi:uncharacterized protein LOC135169394 [Diachasmimorpha longicaudata]|uniref:uncharacterized protein LOC135169394 n=1 Tax=Diachasmimorpha longicaudata TaxID=58733 RepID=UPI0030B8F745